MGVRTGRREQRSRRCCWKYSTVPPLGTTPRPKQRCQIQQSHMHMYPYMFLNKTLQTCNAAAFKCKSVVVLCKRFLPRTQSWKFKKSREWDGSWNFFQATHLWRMLSCKCQHVKSLAGCGFTRLFELQKLNLFLFLLARFHNTVICIFRIYFFFFFSFAACLKSHDSPCSFHPGSLSVNCNSWMKMRKK